MATLKYLPQYFSTKLNVGGGIDDSQTTGIVLLDVSGVDIAKPGQICISYSDPLDTSIAEWIDYTSINGSNELVGAVRGREGYSAKTHLQDATVAFVVSASHHNDIVDLLNGTEAGIKVKTAIYDANGNEVIKTPATASAVNEVTVTNSATGDAVQIAATGGDTDISLNLVTKGAGVLQVNGTPLASEVDSSVTDFMARQALINGNFDVWQRGTTVTGAASNSYLADRWIYQVGADGGTLPTLVQSRQILTSGDIPNAFYHWRLAPNGAGTSLGANSLSLLGQRIEFGNRMLCGLNKKVTLTFWARASVANKRLGISFQQNYGSGGSPSAEEVMKGGTVTLTSSWQKFTVTVTTNTLVGKTFGTDNNDFLFVNFWNQWGTTLGNTYIETSITAEDYGGSGTIDIAQVQLCAGDVALPFQPKSYNQELMDCCRYYYRKSANATYTSARLGKGMAYSSSQGLILFEFPTQMRIIPAISNGGNLGLNQPNTAISATSTVTLVDATVNNCDVAYGGASGLTAGHATMLSANADANAYVAFDAEL